MLNSQDRMVRARRGSERPELPAAEAGVSWKKVRGVREQGSLGQLWGGVVK